MNHGTVNNNSVDHALVSDATRAMARPPGLRFQSLEEERDHLTKKIQEIDSELTVLNRHEQAERTRHFQTFRGTPTAAGHAWLGIKVGYSDRRAGLVERKQKLVEQARDVKRLLTVENARKANAEAGPKDKASRQALGNQIADLQGQVEAMNEKLDTVLNLLMEGRDQR